MKFVCVCVCVCVRACACVLDFRNKSSFLAVVIGVQIFVSGMTRVANANVVELFARAIPPISHQSPPPDGEDFLFYSLIFFFKDLSGFFVGYFYQFLHGARADREGKIAIAFLATDIESSCHTQKFITF